MEINSRDFYQYHSGSYFCKAVIEDGHVTKLYQELGREGGFFWFRDRARLAGDGSPQSGLTSLGRHFGAKFYAAVVKAAPKDKLQPLGAFLVAKAQSEVDRASWKLEEAREKLSKAEATYRKAVAEE